jgi:ubiquinone/menaquinone biosynthesis C-methylase UbiE
MTDDTKQKEYWNSQVYTRPYSHPVVKFFAEQRLKHINSVLSISDETRLLDVGCGDGFSTYYASDYQAKIFGVDSSLYMLNNHPLRSRVACGNAYQLPFRDRSFDVVWSWELLHHLSEPKAALQEMQRVSSKFVVLFEPNRYNPALFLYGLLKKEERWVLRSSRKFLTEVAAASGWEICLIENCGAILPNATPTFLFKLLRLLPFRLPLLGISTLLLAKRRHDWSERNFNSPHAS